MFRLDFNGTQNEVVLDFNKCVMTAMNLALGIAVAYLICLLFNRTEDWTTWVSVWMVMVFFIGPVSMAVIRWRVITTEKSIVVRSLFGQGKEIRWESLKRARQDLDGNLWWLMDESGQIIQIPKGRYDQATESLLNQILQEEMDRLGIVYDCRTYQPSRS